MLEIECSTQSNKTTLKGTICLPKRDGQFPVVLMIHGSGPLNRDGNIKGQELNIFKQIAHYLAEEGIASVRYDKRGCGESEGKYYSSGHFDLVNDALKWFDKLDEYECFDKKFKYLLGHSEGCIIAPQINIKRPCVAGIILLAAFIEPLESILRNQAEVLQKEIDSMKGFSGVIARLFCQILGQPIASQNRLISKIKNTSVDNFYIGLKRVEAKWFRELFTINSSEIFSKVTSPILAITGGKDLQCNPKDLEKLSQVVNVQIEQHVIPNLSHILRYDRDTPSFENYSKQIKEPIEEQVLKCISNWLFK